MLRRIVISALEGGGYSVQKRVGVGERLVGGKHIVDVPAQKDGRRLIVSLKWQQVSGTAEQKVPFEMICLEDALKIGSYDAACEVSITLRADSGFACEELMQWCEEYRLDYVFGLARNSRLEAEIRDELAAAEA
jgi:hypothetical protein